MSVKQKEKPAAKKQLSDGKFAAILLAPATLLIIGLVLYPFLYTIYISVFETNMLEVTDNFIALSQYKKVLADSAFWKSLSVTVYFAVVSIVVQTSLGMGIALLLNTKFKGRGFMRGLILAPWAVPTIVNANLWSWIYQASYGALNKLLLMLGFIQEPIVWLGSPLLAMNMIILADTWRMTPLYVIMFLAGLQTIPESLREAAMIDGAGPFSRFRRITLPLLSPMMLVVLVLRTMQALRVFDIVFVLTQGGPNSGTMVVSYYAYFKTFRAMDFSYGATIGLIVTLLTVLICIVYKKMLQRENLY